MSRFARRDDIDGRSAPRDSDRQTQGAVKTGISLTNQWPNADAMSIRGLQLQRSLSGEGLRIEPCGARREE